MPHSDPKTLVSTAWLAEHIDDADVRVIDASWYLPAMTRNARAEFTQVHISGAQFVDIDTVSDPDADSPHMLPSMHAFSQHMAEIGIGADHQVVVYDGAGLFSAARLWWMFKVFGHKSVAVLDGGLPKWLSEERTVMSGEAPQVTKAAPLPERLQSMLVRSAGQVEAAGPRVTCEIIDARGAARFRGDAQEPRAGLRSGHMPGARNVPYGDVLNADGTLKNSDDLRAVFTAAGVDLSKPAITTCGSGVTAAILSLALERIGVGYALYDGSWAEWGMGSDRAVATGEA